LAFAVAAGGVGKEVLTMAVATTDARIEADPAPPMLDLELSSLGGAPSALLDAVRRNVAATAGALAQVTGVTFRCGCQATLSNRGDAAGPWRVMAWNDSRCASAAHRALKAKWESSNLS
jgi:hypothetical protein